MRKGTADYALVSAVRHTRNDHALRAGESGFIAWGYAVRSVEALVGFEGVTVGAGCCDGALVERFHILDVEHRAVGFDEGDAEGQDSVRHPERAGRIAA